MQKQDWLWTGLVWRFICLHWASTSHQHVLEEYPWRLNLTPLNRPVVRLRTSTWVWECLLTEAVVVGWFGLVPWGNGAQHCGSFQGILSCFLGRRHSDDVVVRSCQHIYNKFLAQGNGFVVLVSKKQNGLLLWEQTDSVFLKYPSCCRNSPCCMLFHRAQCEGVRSLRLLQWIRSSPPNFKQVERLCWRYINNVRSYPAAASYVEDWECSLWWGYLCGCL